MRIAFGIALALALAACAAAADDVVVGTGKNFEQLVKENAFLVAEFYAPWCGHCKNLEPEYAKAAAELKSADPPITLVKIDATEDGNKDLAKKYGVGGFPTILIFRGDADKSQEYNGPRDAAGIVSYLLKKAGPASQLLASQAEVEALKKKDPAVLGVFKDEKSAEYKAFAKAADQLSDDFDFGHTFDADLVEGVAKAPALVIFKPSEAKTLTYDGKFKAKDLEAWLEAKAPPLLPELDASPRNKKALSTAFESKKPKVFGLVAKADKQHDEFVKVLTVAAEENAGELFFISVDPPGNPQALSYFGVKEEDVPAFVIQGGKGGKDKYVARNAAPGDLPKFLDNFKAGKLEKTVKSEDPPKDNSGPVTIVTAKTFDELVLGGKDVLLEFYAPWCGHCKKLTPIYEKVGEEFAKDDSVLIAKMDATANDVPSDKFDVKGFPTIVFVSGKDQTVLPYSGDRSEEDLVKFVKSNASGKAAGKAADEHSEL